MRGYAAIGLVNPKYAANVGGAMRAATAYDANLIIISGSRATNYLNHQTDTAKSWKHMPTIIVDNIFDAMPFDCVPIAVDIITGARPLQTYCHPERAFYIFGAENATLNKQITECCQDVLYIPTRICMNLAATVNVVLYDRMTKSNQPPQSLSS